jgi:hydrogenase expression/formation protein HypD
MTDIEASLDQEAVAVRECAAAIARTARHPWTIMEVCGGQTHAILAHGLDQLLPPGIELVHGPGCPVCVTPADYIDRAIALAAEPGVTLCSFGDMLRVPGSRGDTLLAARARGGDVRVVYSPLDALALASRNPARQVVFFAVGFETTAPASAVAVLQAHSGNVGNFSLLCAHVRVPPAMGAILAAPANRVQGFLAAGHVCTVMGVGEYEPIAREYRVPVVVTGFTPLDILEGILLCVGQLERGEHRVDNQYARAVLPEGNPAARAALREVFAIVTREWRGLPAVPAGGLALKDDYARFDAERRFGLEVAGAPAGLPECHAAAVLQGRLKPTACPHFGSRCTPEHPLGAPMVSSEGACAAFHRYRPQAVVQS